jgi:hypothetical protein
MFESEKFGSYDGFGASEISIGLFETTEAFSLLNLPLFCRSSCCYLPRLLSSDDFFMSIRRWPKQLEMARDIW